jgi:hypothetical protein
MAHADESRPPGFGDEDEEYLRGQAGSVGSGALGGWSQSAFGGAVNAGPKRAVEAIRAELRRIQEQAALPAAQRTDAPRLDKAA